MMMSEFIDRTGFEPTYEEYAEIEEAYYAFNGNKDEFCKHFVENNGEKKVYAARAQKIAELRSRIVEMEKKNQAELKEREQRIALLEAALENEEEWKPYESSDNVKQSDYEELRDCGCTKTLSDEEAADLIADEFGFDRQKIRIIHEVAKLEINRHQRIRKSGSIERLPLYNATDWNYIRFNIRGNVTMSYEMSNGELRLFG